MGIHAVENKLAKIKLTLLSGKSFLFVDYVVIEFRLKDVSILQMDRATHKTKTKNYLSDRRNSNLTKKLTTLH